MSYDLPQTEKIVSLFHIVVGQTVRNDFKGSNACMGRNIFAISLTLDNLFSLTFWAYEFVELYVLVSNACVLK